MRQGGDGPSGCVGGRKDARTRSSPSGIAVDPPPPGTLEFMVLMAVAGWGKEVEARSVYDIIVARTARRLRLASVYVTLDSAGKKGWLTVRTELPRRGAGGWPRKIYVLTPEGARVLVDLAVRLERFWVGARRHGLVAKARRDRAPRERGGAEPAAGYE